MTDDIVTRLRNAAPHAKAADPVSADPYLWSLTGLVNGAADEIERLKKIIHDISDAVTNEGANPKHHRSVVAMLQREWPFLWRRIEIAIKECTVADVR